MQLPKQVGNQYRRWANFGSLSELSYTLSSAFVSHKTFLARLLSAPPLACYTRAPARPSVTMVVAPVPLPPLVTPVAGRSEVGSVLE